MAVTAATYYVAITMYKTADYILSIRIVIRKWGGPTVFPRK